MLRFLSCHICNKHLQKILKLRPKYFETFEKKRERKKSFPNKLQNGGIKFICATRVLGY